MNSTDYRRVVSPIAMSWSRFDAYEVRDGYVRPRPGARLERYDPVADIENGGAANTPYQSLFKLYNDLLSGPQLPDDADDYDVTEEGADAIVQWCTQHGLLGILPHRVYSIVLVPRWARGSERQGWIIEQQEYDRAQDDPAAFRAQVHKYEIGRKAEGCGPEGRPLSTAERRRWRLRDPGVVLYDPQRRAWTHEELSKTWAVFFPDVAQTEAYQYPCPLTEDFWRIYAEPLDLFFRSAAAVWDVIGFLTGRRSELSTLEALDGLRPLVQPAGVVLEHTPPDTFRRVWTSPSLLGWYALRIAEDLAEHAVARRCRVCNTPFLSRAYQARYCSPRCRKTANMRAYRRGLRKKSRRGRRHTDWSRTRGRR